MSNSFQTIWMSPEWAPQAWLWIGFPHDRAEWADDLVEAQVQIAAFANAVADSGQEVRLLVRDAENAARARQLVSSAVRLEQQIYGDIWLRDTGPLCVTDGKHRKAMRFGFNGWGGKYDMAGDETIGAILARGAGLDADAADWILEGGAVDGDGTGLAVTTEQCLLNPNRNPRLNRGDIEARLARDLGFARVLWLGQGLAGDHTDGHVDNLARFVGPNRLAIPKADQTDDPNTEIYADAAQRAEIFGAEIAPIPSPGLFRRRQQIEPASYANFVITNHLVIVPIFGVPNDARAVREIGALFPDRETIGLRAEHILAGGGAFHCASQQMPACLPSDPCD